MQTDSRRIEVIQFRVSQEEKRRIADLAKRRGVTLSDFIRQHTTQMAAEY